MKRIIIACLALLLSACAVSPPLEARTYDAASPPRPGERARAVLRALDARRGPVYLKYRTEEGETVTFAASGGMAYTDVESENVRISTLYDAKTKDVTIISHAAKSYIVANDGPVVLPFEEELARAAEDGKFSASSGSEKIKGARYDFDRIVCEDGSEETFYFLPMTDELKWWRTEGGLAEVLEYGSGGVKEEFFRIPAGYREEKLPQPR